MLSGWRWLACAALLCGAALLRGASVRGQVRVASLNLDKRYGPKLVREMAAQPDLRKADILLLQEVVDGPQAHVAAEIAAALGLHAVFAPAFRLNPAFDEGLAILSRYPAGAASVTRLPHNELHFHTRRRIVLSTTLEAPLGSLRVVDTQLDNRINAAAKQDQLDGVWKALGGYGGPAIVGGDFNSANFRWFSHVIPAPGVQNLNHQVRDDMARHGFSTPLGGGPGTLHFLGLKLDWIYLRGLHATASGVTPIPFSDHNSVWVEIAS